jgi:3-methyl-2-oxobutanoate hydroxymethyltransferase
VERAGAYAILLEGIPPELTEFIHKKLSIPVYGIGAGLPCDGQVIICGDMMGQFQAFTPKFVKKYANVAEVVTNAFKEYVDDVKNSRFPGEEHVYRVKKGCEAEYAAMLKEYDKN